MKSTLRPIVTACVAGDMDLVRALGLAGLRPVVLAEGGAPQRFSRFSAEVYEWPDAHRTPALALRALQQVAARHSDRPVLFYECDADLLLLARHLDLVRQGFRLVMATPALVEDLVDKLRFQALAERLELPVPRSHVVPRGGAISPGVASTLRYPVIVKPSTRIGGWATHGEGAKVLRADDRSALDTILARVSPHTAVVVQHLVPGTEAAIESYHVYVDAGSRIVAEFTGKKIRTWPAAFGDSTALVTTDAADVRLLGRTLVERLSLTGVAKFDFKRAPDGQLYLLEVNPRFTLWHHLGAVAGVNIPACVYADLTGQPRPRMTPVAGGVAWCKDWKDVRAARAAGMSVFRWARWASTCAAHTPATMDDPGPVVGAALWRAAAPIRRARHAMRHAGPHAGHASHDD